MAPLVALVVVTAVLLALGALGLRPLRNWSTALRGGLAAMFALTGGAHFVGMRAELVAMVPPVLPAPELLVTVTGVLELAGAVGLLLPSTARAAAACLTALLVVMFPANVYALVNGIGVAADPFDALLPRTILQVVFVAATVAVVCALRPAAHAARTAAPQPA
ncbi:hypothetical protein WEH80_40470 [Actinomycetes bacterium KLBMP 9759]